MRESVAWPKRSASGSMIDGIGLFKPYAASRAVRARRTKLRSNSSPCRRVSSRSRYSAPASPTNAISASDAAKSLPRMLKSRTLLRPIEEAIANPTNGFDIITCVTQLLPQAFDVRIDGSGRELTRHLPDFLEQPFARLHAAAAIEQHQQQAEFERG